MAQGTEDRVARHYGRSDLEQAILDALAASGKDVKRLTPDDLSPVDEFHTGGRESTAALAEQAGFKAGQHLLDVGCGIGGASRFLAAECGCRVTGIDLTEDYVRAAEALSRRVGLDGQVSYRQTSAVALPFADATPTSRLLVEIRPSLAPSTAARSQPALRWSSVWGSGGGNPAMGTTRARLASASRVARPCARRARR